MRVLRPASPVLVSMVGAAIAMAVAGGFAGTHAAELAGAEPDTTLGGFLGTLSDSTDRYFGLSAARPDTAGQDSALAYGLKHPELGRRRRALGLRPDFAFNRVDGPVWGGVAHVGQPRLLGELTGRLAYSAGPNVWLGGGGYQKTVQRANAGWSLSLFAGRLTASMDRDHA